MPGGVIVAVLVVEIVAVPFDHENEFPPEPFSVIVGVLQVSTCVFGLVEITADGKEISCVMERLVVVAHPF